MGRGLDTEDKAYSILSRRGSRVSSVRPITVPLRDLENQYSGKAVEGEIVTLANGEQVIARADDPLSLMQGLNAVVSVEKQEDGTFVVSFSDGEKAVVDLDDLSVALMSGASDPDRLLGSLHAALPLLNKDSLSPEVQEKLRALSEAKTHYSDYQDEESFRKYIEASKDLADAVLGEELNVKEVEFEGSREEFRRNPQTIERSNAYNRVQAALRSEGSIQGALFGTDADGEAYGLAPEVIKERQEAARRLGADIPTVRSDPTELLLDEKGNPVLDEDGNQQWDPLSARYVMGEQESETLDLVTTLAAGGQRFFIHRGPPGCGKDTFWREIAAFTGRPYELISFGPEAKLEEAIGGSDFETVEIKEKRWVEERDEKTGEVVKDKDGSPKMREEEFVVGSAMVLKEKLGRMGELMKEPSLIVLTEPEGSFGEGLVRLNKALGDDYGDPSGRTFYVNSVAGGTHKVHEDCIIVITHNMDNIEGDEQRFRASTHDRAGMGNIEWGTRPIEEDAAILAGMARARTRQLVAENVPWSEGGRGERNSVLYPGIDEITITPEDMMPIAQLMAHVRNDMDQGEGDFIEGIEMRRAISLWDTYRAMAYSSGPEIAGKFLEKGLISLFDGTEGDHKERRAMAENHARNTKLALEPMGMRFWELSQKIKDKMGDDFSINKAF